jgi:hypothetical protein
MLRRFGIGVLFLAGGAATALATNRQGKDVCNRFASQAWGQTMKPGDWGTVPKEVQKLPPGAKLCGSVGGFVTVIASPLEGKVT